MINIIFFSKYREQFSAASLDVVASGIGTVQNLISYLQARFPERTGFLSDQKMIISINQELARPESSLKDGDVVAFFPPVTGG